MEFKPQTCIADIVAAFPAARQVLLRHGIPPGWDGLTLREAAERAGTELDRLLSELAGTYHLFHDHRSFPAEWTANSIDELVVLVADLYHTELRHLLPSLGLRISAAILEHGDDCPELYDVGRLFKQLRAELSHHCSAEDEAFAALRAGGELDEEQLGRLLASLREDHQRIAALLRQIRALTLDYPLRRYDRASMSRVYEEWREVERVASQAMFLEENRLIPLLLDLFKDPPSASVDG